MKKLINPSQTIRWELPRYTRGTGVEISTAPTKAYPHFVSLDTENKMIEGHLVPPDIKVQDLNELTLFASQSLDFIVTNRTNELKDRKRSLENYWSKLKADGFLVLILDEKDEYEGIQLKNAQVACNKLYGDDKDVKRLFVLCKGGNYHARELMPEAFLCRLGAYGDNLQASSVAYGLKKQGYRVIYMGSNPGLEVLTNDPNIDEFYIVEKDQIPNHNLVEFWNYQATQFDKFVNLSESVEGTFLALPGRTPHEWHPALREEMMNKNYLEFSHKLAKVPHDPQVKFYPTIQENKWAFEQKQKMGKRVIMWSLSGSSVHKSTHHLDQIIARILLTYSDAHVILVGGPEAVILEAGWENEPRVTLTSGKWSIRQTLTMANQCDLVIGPETGVLNSVCCEKNSKIIYLSHSTVENLTRDWVNTQSLFSHNTVCPGRGNNEAMACHQLHYGWKHCKQADTGTAQCMADIDIEEAWQAVQKSLDPICKKKTIMMKEA